MKKAREIYDKYIEMMNEGGNEKRELILYQDWEDSFAVMKLSKEVGEYNYTDFQLYRIDYYGNVDIIRTFSFFTEALTAFSALAYQSKPIITLPF